MSSISDVFAAGLESVRKSWGWFFAEGWLDICSFVTRTPVHKE